jgi:hypothetical protein
MASIAPSLSSEALPADAYARVLPQLLGLNPDHLLQVNLDISSAIATVLGVLPKVRALRAQIAELPAFDMAAFDQLEDYALALSFAQTIYLMARRPPDDLQTLSDQASRMRAAMRADATVLATRGLINAEQLKGLKGRRGYKNVAQDLQILSSIFEDSWPKVDGKTITTLADAQAASRVATKLLRTVGVHEQTPERSKPARDLRTRAFTRLLRVYEDTRRALRYLSATPRKADEIAPSLYPGRPRRKRAEAEPVSDGQVQTESAEAAVHEPVGGGAAEVNATLPSAEGRLGAHGGVHAGGQPFLA